MKKTIAGLATASAVLLMAGAVNAAEVNVTVDGEALKSDTEAIIENDYTLVPMRAVFEALGARVEWIDNERSVMAFKGTRVIKLTIDADSMTVNNEETPLGTPARIINDRTYVPLRAVSESLGAKVSWDSETRTASIDNVKSEYGVNTLYRESAVKDDNGNDILNIVMSYPEVKTEKYNTQSVNEFFDNYADKLSEDIGVMLKEELLQMRDEYTAVGKTLKTPLVFGGVDVTYEKNGLISFVAQSVFECEGQAECITLYAYTFDMKTGDMLDKTDVLNIGENDANMLKIYDFYLFDNAIVLCLSSDNMMYYNYGYQPTMGIEYSDTSKDLFKIDLTTGEAKQFGEPIQLFEQIDEEMTEGENKADIDDQQAEGIISCKNLYELTNKAGFAPAVLSDESRFIPVSYELLDGACTRVTYKTDIDENIISVYKAEGDFQNTNRQTDEKMTEKLINNSMVEYYEDENGYYACFSVQRADGKIYSYCVETKNKDMVVMNIVCNDIIKKEELSK